jgi:hypothetical protein
MINCEILPENWYDGAALTYGLHVPEATLARARREGRLRFSRRGNRVFYRGSWVLDWLSGEQQGAVLAE